MGTGSVIFLTLMKARRTFRWEVLFLQNECEQTVGINQYSAQRVCYLQCAVSRDAFLLTLKGTLCVWLRVCVHNCVNIHSHPDQEH